MAPRSAQTPVRLNVYDLTEANDYMTYIGLGFFHTGVEIAGDEFSFASGAGVFSSTPRDAPGARFRESIDMGVFPGSASEARSLALSLRPEFGGDSYNLLTKNCNAYSDALCRLLLNKPIPPHLNRAAYVGSLFSCLLPEDVTGQAPVGDASATTAASAVSNRRTEYSVFGGEGMAAGGTSATASKTPPTSSAASTLADRREKVRLAALQRLQKPNDTNS